jgi:hypothetical protein
MLVTYCVQGEEQWWSEKLGKPSASRFDEILTASGTVSKSRHGYLCELAAQRITGQRVDGHVSSAMEEGNSREHESRILYELLNDVTVLEVGVIYPDENKHYLCSPDGIVDGEWGLEMKNVLPKTQVSYLIDGKLPVKYIVQVQGSLLVTGFERWDFMSYSPGLPAMIIIVERDEAFIGKLKAELEAFCLELDAVTERLMAMR